MGIDIFVFGIIYVDYFYGDIFCMCKFLYSEIVGEYEKNTGLVIVEEFCYCYIDLMVVLSVIVVGYVFFFWGKNVEDVVYNVVVLEEIFVMVFVICLFNSGIKI